jgi:general secretion pathway protein G
MKQNLNRSIARRSKQSGFSLIEILLVVGIIAFLASMVAVGMIGQKTGADIKNAKTGTKMVYAKAATYFLDTGSAPSKIEDLVTKPGDVPNWKGPYLTEGQAKDPWNTPYVLKSPGEHMDIDIVSYGADRKEGGSENNADIGNWQ